MARLSPRTTLGLSYRGIPLDRLRQAVSGKIVLVTGASEGIGRATAVRLGQAGATVLLAARTAERLESARAEIGSAVGTAFAYPCDLSDTGSVTALTDKILERHGHVDVIVNNAGHSIRRSVAASYDRLHDYERTANLNYLGPVALLLRLLPVMRERGAGHIVNVSTAGVLVPGPGWSAYLGSKAAFDAWLRCAAPEIRMDGVTATSIYFGVVHTRMSAPNYQRTPGLTPEQAAGVICRAIAERPRTIGPWWARMGAVAGVAANGPLERSVSRYVKARRGIVRTIRRRRPAR